MPLVYPMSMGAPVTWHLKYGLVTNSLTVSVVTLRLRETTVALRWDLRRARSIITNQPISLQRSSTGDLVCI